MCQRIIFTNMAGEELFLSSACVLEMYLIFIKFAGCIFVRKSIGKAQIQIHHQPSVVIGLFTPRESIFRQMDIMCHVPVSAMLLPSFIKQPYRHFP